MTGESSIHLSGVRTHNLKNISCDIPHRQITVVTGVSGSGKSSLAFDTLYAEGQRRYVESMSTYARQFLERLEKPEVDEISHVLPAVALEQKNGVTNARSTVGSITETVDALRSLMAQKGCPPSPQPSATPLWATETATINGLADMVGWLSQQPEKTRLLICAPISLPQTVTAAAFKRLLTGWKHQGLTRWVNADGAVIDLATEKPPGIRAFRQSPLLVLDRIITKASGMNEQRLREALKQAIRLQYPALVNKSGGMITADTTDGLPGPVWLAMVPAVIEDTTPAASVTCGLYMAPMPTVTPQHLSFNHPLGACPVCEGYGRVIGLDMAKVIPNPKLAINEGLIHPFASPAYHECQELLEAMAKRQGIPTAVPYDELPEAYQQLIINGDGSYEAGGYGGIRPFFDWLETKRYKVHVRVMLAKYRGYYACNACEGSRLNPVARQVAITTSEDALPVTLPELCNWPLEKLQSWLTGFQATLANDDKLNQRLCYEVLSRLEVLTGLGLGYLTLSRQSRTLSGGEMQRIQLASAIGSWLTDTLYVFDEPTVGLHARDTDRLLGVLRQLRDLGNTLVVVEHDPEMITGSDYVIDLGPKAGSGGGRIVFEGTPDTLMTSTVSATGEGLRQLDRASASEYQTQRALPAKTHWFGVTGANGNNLQNVTLSVPSRAMVAVVGVSGSGKSTLIKQSLYANASHRDGKELNMDAAPIDDLIGLEQFSEMIMVDQSPPGKSKRSNPATYVKAWDGIRALYGNSRQAKAVGLSASSFSFNRPGGRCETCEGLGYLTIDMQFLADVTMTCTECNGRRFGRLALGVQWQNKAGITKPIDEVLKLTVDEALDFFEGYPKITKPLGALKTIGLGYVQLGQSTSTLSGGEAQRMKLATFLLESIDANGDIKRLTKKPLCLLFDEPTTGLHMQDIDTLIGVLNTLVEAGHSVVVVEHHLQLIAAADYVVELGPEGGNRGGHIVFEGTQKDFRQADTVTSQCL
jgi:excinuclease ABC subunit A